MGTWVVKASNRRSGGKTWFLATVINELGNTGLHQKGMFPSIWHIPWELIWIMGLSLTFGKQNIFTISSRQLYGRINQHRGCQMVVSVITGWIDGIGIRKLNRSFSYTSWSAFHHHGLFISLGSGNQDTPNIALEFFIFHFIVWRWGRERVLALETCTDQCVEREEAHMAFFWQRRRIEKIISLL